MAPAETPSLGAVRSPKTGTARVSSTPQYARNEAILCSLSFRIRKCTTEALRPRSFATRRLPMKPVAPVTKYRMNDLREFLVGRGILAQCDSPNIPHKPARGAPVTPRARRIGGYRQG